MKVIKITLCLCKQIIINSTHRTFTFKCMFRYVQPLFFEYPSFSITIWRQNLFLSLRNQDVNSFCLLVGQFENHFFIYQNFCLSDLSFYLCFYLYSNILKFFVLWRTRCYFIFHDEVMYFSVYCKTEGMNKGLYEFLTKFTEVSIWLLICGSFIFLRNVTQDCLRKMNEWDVKDTSHLHIIWEGKHSM